VPVPTEKTSSDQVVIYSDLEPDDTLAIVILLNYLGQQGKFAGKPPIIIFVADDTAQKPGKEKHGIVDR
jgi:hypothetical protein